MAAMDDPKLIETLTRIETKLDHFIKESSDHESRIRTLEHEIAPTKDHEDRLKAVEKKVWSIPGASIIIDIVLVVITYFQLKH